MAIFLKHQSNREDYNYKEYIADNELDKAQWPTNCAPGSTVFVITGSKVYMLNNEKEWKEI